MCVYICAQVNWLGKKRKFTEIVFKIMLMRSWIYTAVFSPRILNALMYTIHFIFLTSWEVWPLNVEAHRAHCLAPGMGVRSEMLAAAASPPCESVWRSGLCCWGLPACRTLGFRGSLLIGCSSKHVSPSSMKGSASGLPRFWTSRDWIARSLSRTTSSRK